jgi:hypothetical protein
MCFEIAISLAFVRPFPLTAIERNVETFLNKSLFNPVNFHCAVQHEIGSFIAIKN